MPSAKGFRGRRLAVWAAALGLFLLCLLAGRYPSPGLMDPRVVLDDPLASTILFGSRLPRALGAVLLGAVLAAAGNAFQMVFGNPLVEPGFLGVSQGAAFGAALALVLGLGAGGGAVVAAFAFVFAVAGLCLSLALARAFRFGGWVLRLVLGGIACSAAFSSALAVAKFAADPLRELPDIAFWTMGGLYGMTWSSLASVAPPAALSLAVLYLLRWRITLLSLDDESSFSLGARPKAEKALVLAAGALGVASVTAACGIVGWVGLVAPQAARALAGSDGRSSMPLSIALGASFALACDAFARAAFPGELPLGAVTGLAGAVLFSILLASRAVRVSR